MHQYGSTALHGAAAMGAVEVLKILLKKGAKIDFPNNVR